MKSLLTFCFCVLLPLLTGCWAGANFRARQNERWGEEMLATNQSSIMPPLPPVRAVQRSQPVVVPQSITTLRFTWFSGGGSVTGLQFCTNLAIPQWTTIYQQPATNGAPCAWMTNITLPWCFYRAFDL